MRPRTALSRFAGLAPRGERDLDAQRLEPAAKVARMLVGEKLRRCHERNLPPRLDGAGRRQRRHQRLAAAHIALHQPQHRLRELQVRLDLGEHAFLGARRPKRQGRKETVFERARGHEGPARVVLDTLAQELQRQLVRQKLLESEPPLCRMASIEEQRDRCIGGRPMHVLQRLAQARQLHPLEKRRRQPVHEVPLGRLIERRAHQLPEPSLSEPFGPGIDRRQMLIGTDGFRDVGPAVFRVHDLQARRPATHFAEAADAHAPFEPLLLFRREMKEPQREIARAVAHPR